METIEGGGGVKISLPRASFRPMCRYLFDDFENSVVHVCISELVKVSVFYCSILKRVKIALKQGG